MQYVHIGVLFKEEDCFSFSLLTHLWQHERSCTRTDRVRKKSFVMSFHPTVLSIHQLLFREQFLSYCTVRLYLVFPSCWRPKRRYIEASLIRSGLAPHHRHYLLFSRSYSGEGKASGGNERTPDLSGLPHLALIDKPRHCDGKTKVAALGGWVFFWVQTWYCMYGNRTISMLHTLFFLSFLSLQAEEPHGTVPLASSCFSSYSYSLLQVGWHHYSQVKDVGCWR